MNEKALEDYHKDESTESFLENLKNAAFLYIDLRNLDQTPPKDRNFEWAIYYMMIKAASDSVGEEAEDPDAAFKACYKSASRLVRKLRTILNIPSSQYIIVAFDEIGALEEITAKFELSRHPGVTAIDSFISIGYVNIKEHLEKSPTRLPNRPLVSEFLCGASFRVEELADALLEYSGGVPGLLTRAVNILLNHVRERKEPPLSKEKCIELMENNHFQEFCTKPFESGLSITDENTRQSLDILLMMALYHIPFTLDSNLPSRVSVFVFGTEMGFIKVLLIDMFICHFENLSNISLLGKLYLGMLRTEPVDCFIIPIVVFLKDQRGLAPSLVAGIVCKDCWKSERLNWSDIISEAEKFLVPIHDQILSESLKTCHCMLIIVSTKLSSTVTTELNYESCCYSSGSLIGDTFKIPTNC
eukprot:jgi/Galph1/5331/GphlegSOOS_G3934.1